MNRRGFLGMLVAGGLARIGPARARRPIAPSTSRVQKVMMTEVSVDLSPRQVSERLDDLIKQLTLEVNNEIYGNGAGRFSCFDVPAVFKELNAKGEWVPVYYRPAPLYLSSASGRPDGVSKGRDE